VRIWIDTDLGSDVDDALALGYALEHPSIELVGVSTVFGDVELRTRMVEMLLHLAGRGDLPVITGLGKPLTPERKGLMFGHEGRGLIDDPQPRMRTTENPDEAASIDALAEAMSAARPDAVVAIGPMTNLGALARAGATLPPLAVMGGKVEDVVLEGMLAGVEEWNWFCDPIAVQLALEAAASPPMRVVPAEVTWRTQLAEGDVERLAAGGPLARALSTLSGEWLAFQRDRLGSKSPRVALHDPLTVATLVESQLCHFDRCRITVDDNGATQRVPGEVNAEVAVDVDRSALRDHLMATWLDRGAGPDQPLVPSG